MDIDELKSLPRIPTDADAELIFNTPWEAKAFALVVQLYQQGHFSWSEWAAQLGSEIAAAPDDDGSGYYLLWLRAAEKIVAAKALCDDAEITARRQALEVNQGGPAAASAGH